MLRKRLLTGTLLIGMIVGVLIVDQWLARWWYPFLLSVALGFLLASAYEMVQLLGSSYRLAGWLVLAGVIAVVLANWPAHIGQIKEGPWPWILGAFVAVVMAAFLVEMAFFREPGGATARIALTVWVVAYLAILPSFIVQLRWLPDPANYSGRMEAGSVALALAVFVPKCGDIGAYFSGRFLGRNRMTPLLSPKKTWEGALGGLTTAAVAAVAIDRLLGPIVPGGWLGAVGFGLTVGLAGMLGDLAESLIKRDCRQKDAAQTVPGFGGMLDVVDSVLFAGPVAYAWLVGGRAVMG